MRLIFHRHYQTLSQTALSLFSGNAPSLSTSMAQRTEKEETEFKVPEALTLCVNNCGLAGNPATNSMCQNCFNATTAPSSSPSSTASAQIPTLLKFSSGDMTPRSRLPRRSESTVGSRTLKAQQDRPTPTQGASESESTLAASRREVNRCSGCRRKVGLTGFRCRCGDLFCSEHRYTDRHVCSYDYKSAGREMIARENPVVKAAKIVKV